MKLTLSWLKDHLETDAGLDDVCTRLTALGLEVEGVEDRGKALASFIVAHVVSAERHPNADKLQVCVVDTGRERLQVVCGAPNARAGMKGVFAAVGTKIPDSGAELKKGVIRGVESCGMLCSERAGLSDAHSVIIELPDEAPIGASFAEIAGLNDPVIEIALTPDRADCAAVRGVARDLAASGLGRLKPLTGAHLDSSPVKGEFPSATGVTIDSDALSVCPLFIGRVIRGVRNGQSPRWVQDRLTAIGLRPISALVDVTNYLTIDVARPLHVFDSARLNGDIRVRFAAPGESLAALNGKTYDLDPSMTVIADQATAQSLAGIVGGAPTGCSAETTDVIIECAPVRSRAHSNTRSQTWNRFRRALSFRARNRFSRRLRSMERATRLILDWCGGTPGELVVAGAIPIQTHTDSASNPSS
ncbi:phenylalanyl-tRNA synthetase beta chain [Azospirillaceae bacterium]